MDKWKEYGTFENFKSREYYDLLDRYKKQDACKNFDDFCLMEWQWL